MEFKEFKFLGNDSIYSFVETEDELERELLLRLLSKRLVYKLSDNLYIADEETTQALKNNF